MKKTFLIALLLAANALAQTVTMQTTARLTDSGEDPRWHLGSSAVKTSTFYPAGVTVTNTDDVDGGGNVIGTLMRVDFPSSTAAMEAVTVFSETLVATSYSGGVLTLNDGTRVTFANKTVDVQIGRSGKRRAVKP